MMDQQQEEQHYWSRLFGRGKSALDRCRQGCYENTQGMELYWCQAGTFTMGSPESEEGREPDEIQRPITLTQGFWMARYLVTQHLWGSLMGTNPSRFPKAGPDAPVESMGFDDALEFCQRLTRKDRAKRRLPKGAYYTLPTEAQWEYACRAGSSTAFSSGASLSSKQANFNGRLPYPGASKGPDRKKPIPVGQFPPNPWGLCDMHGNVHEWCLDLYGPYDPDQTIDPRGAVDGLRRVVRGGSWYDLPKQCRSAARTYGEPGPRRLGALGMRAVLVAP